VGNGLIARGIKRTKRVLLVGFVYPFRPPPISFAEALREIGVDGSDVVAVLAVGLATLANYLGWLGWDQTKDRGSDGYLTGPYEPWQIVGLVLVLAVIAATAGWRRRPWVAIIVTTGVMWLCVLASGAIDPNADGLFLIGAFSAAVSTFTGVGVVALVADGIASSKSPGGGTAGWHRRPWVWIVMTVMVMVTLEAWL
jgi:hypothetical protein